jgi:hypothetical protein
MKQYKKPDNKKTIVLGKDETIILWESARFFRNFLRKELEKAKKQDQVKNIKSDLYDLLMAMEAIEKEIE